MEGNKYTVNKSTVECYKIRHASGMYWADIIVDAKEKTGRITIASDFGTWQNYWNACGSDFKDFLTGLDMHYCAGKFGATGWFDVEATLKAYRSTAERLPEEKRDAALQQIDEMADYIHREEFTMHLWQQDDILDMYDGAPDLVTDVTPGFKRFWNEVWPVFVAELKSEMVRTEEVES